VQGRITPKTAIRTFDAERLKKSDQQIYEITVLNRANSQNSRRKKKKCCRSLQDKRHYCFMRTAADGNLIQNSGARRRLFRVAGPDAGVRYAGFEGFVQVCEVCVLECRIDRWGFGLLIWVAK
jgi:hypothetical protein